MTWEWKIGDPVDDSNGGTMDAMNWGHAGDEDDSHDWIEDDLTDPKISEYAKKAWNYYMEFKETEALHYINLALDLNDMNAGNWNIKAIILEAMESYGESEECYNRSLELFRRDLVYDNKARMLYRWAVHLREESKKLPNGLDMLRKSKEKAIKAMKTLPGENSKEDLDKYHKLIESIDFYIDYEHTYQGNLEALKEYDKSELFTITGRRFYKNNVVLVHGMPLRLVRELGNEFDSDAIAVYAEDEKIGYVANGGYTKSELTSSASQLQDKIEDTAHGEYLLYLNRYAEIQFAIGRIVK